jgi:hypothetical protein
MGIVVFVTNHAKIHKISSIAYLCSMGQTIYYIWYDAEPKKLQKLKTGVGFIF